nr:MAG TPA: hypothetical protein [Bacteriophage sp.]
MEPNPCQRVPLLPYIIAKGAEDVKREKGTPARPL